MALLNKFGTLLLLLLLLFLYNVNTLFVEDATNLTAADKGIIILICEGDNINSSFNWLKDGHEFKRRGTPIVKFEKGQMVRLDPVRKSDNGTYVCQVDGNEKSKINVKILGEDEIPAGFPKILNEGSEPVSIQLNGTGKIECKGSGHQELRYDWFFKGRPVRYYPTNKYIVSNETLIINNVTENDKGGYECQAFNSYGLATSPVITTKVVSELRPSPSGIKYHFPNTRSLPPKFFMMLILALMLVIVLFVALYIFYRSQKQVKKFNETKVNLLPNMVVYGSAPLQRNDNKKNYFIRGPIPKNLLKEHIEYLKADNHLKAEYESIEPNQQFTWDNSLLSYNRSKNRYANVVAYDHSRVVLKTIDNIPGSDYINANHCNGYRNSNLYIATQGPLEGTVADFWRMVWEQKSKTIVMITLLEERGRAKCYQYWPDQGSLYYNGLIITSIQFEELPYHNIRTFKLQYNDEAREVKQFQFTAWPDHGVPDHPTPFLLFLKGIKCSNPPYAGPMIVLCSAGVGRTGCFIAIDSMIERLNFEDTIDIYSTVTRLRAQRNYMVQTEEQYMFIHNAILESINSAQNEVPVCNYIQRLS